MLVGMFRRLASLTAGILLGVALSELGLRLYFYDHEANRNYWGRYAFVEDAVLPYRHAPSTTAVAGREDSFGPHRITTNELGFRDHRVGVDADTSPPRIIVAGASFMFGLGIEEYGHLFHVQLERLLRQRDNCPRAFEVFNIAQTGFKLNEICTLAVREVNRLRPRLVVLAFRENETTHFRNKKLDLVNGYRLAQGRPWAGTWVDYLRTDSYLWMRQPDPARLVRNTGLGRAILYVWHLVDPDRFATAGHVSGRAGLFDVLGEFRRRLEAMGIDLVCLAIYPSDPASLGFSDTLRQRGFLVIDVCPGSGWTLPREGHWNAYGHAKVAELVARQIPCSCLEVRRSRP